MTDKFTPQRYHPHDWVGTRSGDILLRHNVLEKMLREAGYDTDEKLAKLYADVFTHIATGLFDNEFGPVPPDLNAEYMFYLLDSTLWQSVLGHEDDTHMMPCTQKTEWTTYEMTQRPWSVEYGVYFHNRAFLDGDGAHVTQSDGTVLKGEYTLKKSIREAQTKEALDMETAIVNNKTAKTAAEYQLALREMIIARRVAERTKAVAMSERRQVEAKATADIPTNPALDSDTEARPDVPGPANSQSGDAAEAFPDESEKTNEAEQNFTDNAVKSSASFSRVKDELVIHCVDTSMRLDVQNKVDSIMSLPGLSLPRKWVKILIWIDQQKHATSEAARQSIEATARELVETKLSAREREEMRHFIDTVG